jgi:hypothetical protein
VASDWSMHTLSPVGDGVGRGLFFTRLMFTAGPLLVVDSDCGLGGGLSPPDPEGCPKLFPLGVELLFWETEPTVAVVPPVAGELVCDLEVPESVTTGGICFPWVLCLH